MVFFLAYLVLAIIARDLLWGSVVALTSGRDTVGHRVCLLLDLLLVEDDPLKAKASAQFYPSNTSNFLIALSSNDKRRGLEKLRDVDTPYQS